MKHQQRVELYKAYMAAEGVRMDVAVPRLWAFLWGRGIELPPPPFLGFLSLGLIAGPGLALVPMGLWLFDHLRFHRHHVPWSVAVWLAVAAGLVGFVASPVYYRRIARRYGLLRWESFYGLRQRD